MKILKWVMLGFLFLSGLACFVFGGLMMAAAAISLISPRNPEFKFATNVAGLIAHGMIPFSYGIVVAYCSVTRARRHELKKLSIGCMSPFLFAVSVFVGAGLILAQFEDGTRNGLGIFVFAIIPLILAIYTIKPLFRKPTREPGEIANDEAQKED